MLKTRALTCAGCYHSSHHRPETMGAALGLHAEFGRDKTSLSGRLRRFAKRCFQAPAPVWGCADYARYCTLLALVFVFVWRGAGVSRLVGTLFPPATPTRSRGRGGHQHGRRYGHKGRPAPLQGQAIAGDNATSTGTATGTGPGAVTGAPTPRARIGRGRRAHRRGQHHQPKGAAGARIGPGEWGHGEPLSRQIPAMCGANQQPPQGSRQGPAKAGKREAKSRGGKGSVIQKRRRKFHHIKKSLFVPALSPLCPRFVPVSQSA